MANPNFKTAAAKLLAQHAAKKENPLTNSTSAPSVEPVPTMPSVRTYHPSARSAGSELAPLVRGAAIPVLAVLGCAIMVFLVPETIFGLWFNVLFGLVSGAVFGYIIVREL
jgi:uncharacterized RDD family membrane protein YckC